jgi:hypothetical protein
MTFRMIRTWSGVAWWRIMPKATWSCPKDIFFSTLGVSPDVPPMSL